METIKRQVEDHILDALLPNKVVMLYGARRVGKTVLVKRVKDKLSGQVLYLNGEDYDVLTMLENRSVSNYRHIFQGVDAILLDEAQHIPDIGHKLKLIVDEIEGIRILATGSSSFDLLNKTGAPLVGRSSTFELFPFSQKELMSFETVPDTIRNLEYRLIYGSYPEVTRLDSFARKSDYLKEIVNVYLLKDILSVDGVKNAGKMKNLLRLLAFQVGQEVFHTMN